MVGHAAPPVTVQLKIVKIAPVPSSCAATTVVTPAISSSKETQLLLTDGGDTSSPVVNAEVLYKKSPATRSDKYFAAPTPVS